jgi:hypothetical protein
LDGVTNLLRGQIRDGDGNRRRRRSGFTGCAATSNQQE